jgi:hypothetical protein
VALLALGMISDAFETGCFQYIINILSIYFDILHAEEVKNMHISLISNHKLTWKNSMLSCQQLCCSWYANGMLKGRFQHLKRLQKH